MKTIKNVQPKSFTKFGTTHHPKEINIYHADITPRKSIRIYGTMYPTCQPVDFDKTFSIGDQAEYDSYNLSYIGKIIAIGAKTITIEDYDGKHRLDLHTFTWRNWDFNAKRIFENNCDTMMRI